MSGVVRALLKFHHSARIAGVDPKVAEQAATAIDLIGDLLRVLPAGPDLASSLAGEYARVRSSEGPTRRAAKLRDSYAVVESVLGACHSHSLSTNIKSVVLARNHLEVLAAAVAPSRAEVTWGDSLSPSFHGASIRVTHHGGGNAELNLRQIHPELDVNLPTGEWILEGGAWSGEGAGKDVSSAVEVVLGKELPDDLGEVLERTFRKMICIASSGVKVVQITRQVPSESNIRAAAL